jgi:proline iminopeptidase
MLCKHSVILISLVIFIALFVGCKPKQFTPHEGFIDVTGGKVWYRVNGSGNATPVVLLHGGPGSSSYYLDALKPLSKDRPVIFIDQLGCGRSSRITDTTLMTIENYVEQLEVIRKALGLSDFYLYGHSWGTMLAMDYYLAYPEGIKALVFNSPLFSTELWLRDADTLIAALPDSIQLSIRENEKTKTYTAADYQTAVAYFYKNFLRRSEQPQEKADSSAMFTGLNVYEFMWGPSEFTATGNLLHYDRINNLNGIGVPTLLLTGEYDEARPSTVNYYHTLIPGSEFVIINDAAHETMNDNQEETLYVINHFLQKIDTQKH